MEQGGTFSGVVRRASYLGDVTDYDVEVEGTLLTIIETDPAQMARYDEGSTIQLMFRLDCIHVLPQVE